MFMERHWFWVTVVNGKMYAIGGYMWGSVSLGVNEEYDVSTNVWTVKESLVYCSTL